MNTATQQRKIETRQNVARWLTTVPPPSNSLIVKEMCRLDLEETIEDAKQGCAIEIYTDRMEQATRDAFAFQDAVKANPPTSAEGREIVRAMAVHHRHLLKELARLQEAAFNKFFASAVN
jgi:hypothetical protein